MNAPLCRASIAGAARRIALDTITTGRRSLDREPVRNGTAAVRADPAPCIPSTDSPYFGRGGSRERSPDTSPPIVPGGPISERRLGLPGDF